MNLKSNGECGITGNMQMPNESLPLPAITNEKISGIYKIINKINGKYYVGSAKTIKTRWNVHKSELNRKIHDNSHFQRAWNKYGESSFDIVIVEQVAPDKLREVEQRYLDIARLEKDKCYNMNFLADRIEMTPLINNKIKKALIKYYKSNPNPMLGKTHSLKTIIKMKQNHNINSKNYDKVIYNFYNKNLNKIFIGKRSEFIKKYNLHKGAIYGLIFKKYRIKSVKGWIVT